MPKIITYPNTDYFTFENVNPKNKRTGDCVVRAISKAMNKPWHEVIDEMIPYMHKYCSLLNEPTLFTRYLEDQGFRRMKQPRKFDNTKYTGKDFVNYLNDNYYLENRRIVANIGWHHTTCFVDEDDGRGYTCHDIWDPTDKTIGNYWIK